MVSHVSGSQLFQCLSSLGFLDDDEIAGLLRRLAAAADDHEIITVPIELADAPMTILPPSIQRMQIEVGQDGADDPTLRNATARLVPLPVDDHTGCCDCRSSRSTRRSLIRRAP